MALLAHPTIEPNRRNGYGATALHNAARNGRKGTIEVVAALLSHPAIDTQITDKEGKTAYELAQVKGYESIVSLLREGTIAAVDSRPALPLQDVEHTGDAQVAVATITAMTVSVTEKKAAAAKALEAARELLEQNMVVAAAAAVEREREKAAGPKSLETICDILIARSKTALDGAVTFHLKADNRPKRVVSLYKNGFVVDTEGVLRRINDPVNEAFLRALEEEKIPEELRYMNSRRIFAPYVAIEDHRSEESKHPPAGCSTLPSPPAHAAAAVAGAFCASSSSHSSPPAAVPATYTAYSGTGNTLGGGEKAIDISSNDADAHCVFTADVVSSTDAVVVDESKTCSTVQVKTPAGKKLRIR